MPSKNKLTLYAVTTSMLWFSLYAYVAELSTYADTLGASYKMIGLITGSYGLTQLILRIPLGLFSDMLGRRKPFILAGLLVASISSAVSFFSPSPVSLLVTRSLAGVAAATWVVITVLYASYFKHGEATKAIGRMNSYNAIGQLAAMAMGGFISYLFGTRYLFLLGALGGLIGFLTSFHIEENKKDHKKAKLQDFVLVAQTPQLQIVSLLGILSQFITFATAFGFVPILAKNLGAVSYELSALAALSIIPAIFISRLAGDTFVRRFGKKATMNTGFFLSGLICAIMPFSPNLWVLYGLQFIGGIGRSLVFPLLMGLGIEPIKSEQRATAMGFFQAMYGIGMVVGPIFLGFIGDVFGLTKGFLFTSVFALVGALIVTVYFKGHTTQATSH